jgi:hypothetical protein
MFNRLRLVQYRQLLGRAFEILHWDVALSPQGRAFKRAHPATWQTLLGRQAEIDLLAKAVYFLGRKPA